MKKESEVLPICRNCKSFSPCQSTETINHVEPKTGWCMKLRRGVYAHSGCAEHRYKMEGRYEQEAIQQI